MGRLAGSRDVMHLSQLKSFIDRSVKSSSGKYKAFSTLYLTPVGFSKDGMKTMPPRQD